VWAHAEEFWHANPELQRVPIFFSSKLASKSLEVYKVFDVSIDRLMYGMHGCMDAWMHGCMDAWMHGCMDAWMHGCMVAWMHGCMDG
jgi:hypothetical protein